MSKFGIDAQINPEITIRLTEREARALDALAGYGFKSFIEIFYKLGTHYMKPYEKDLESLFDKIRGESGIGMFISRADDARAVFRGEKATIPHDSFKRLGERSDELSRLTKAGEQDEADD